MGNTRREFKYTCSDDCRQEGCPSHIAVMEYQSTAGILSFYGGNGGQKYWFDSSKLGAFLTMLKDIGNVRCEIEHALEIINNPNNPPSV